MGSFPRLAFHCADVAAADAVAVAVDPAGLAVDVDCPDGTRLVADRDDIG